MCTISRCSKNFDEIVPPPISHSMTVHRMQFDFSARGIGRLVQACGKTSTTKKYYSERIFFTNIHVDIVYDIGSWLFNLA